MTGEGQSLAQAQELAEAMKHLQARRFSDARRLLSDIARRSPADPQPLLMLAVATERSGDVAEANAVLDRFLELQPTVVSAWLLKGDWAARAEDRAGASAFYGRAFAEAKRQNLPDDVQAKLAAARKWLDQSQEQQTRELEQMLVARGVDPQTAPRRFRQSLEYVSGKRQVYVQQPSTYFFPGLPQIEVFDREGFNWAERFESYTDAIEEEFRRLVSDPEVMKPHITSNNLTPTSGHDGMADNAGWSSVQLWRDGEPVPELVAKCPKTFEALKLVPQPNFSKANPSAPAVIFSVLGAGAHIPPHTGSTNVRLICHLPLIVPPDCHLRVGNEICNWERGKLLVFDDTIEHEARNDSDQERAVLIFDIWRPELSEDERAAITTMFRCREALASGAKS